MIGIYDDYETSDASFETQKFANQIILLLLTDKWQE